MTLGQGELTYTWNDNWATLPDIPSAAENGRTHGVCVTNAGNVVVFAQIVDGLLTYGPDGSLLSATGGDRWLGAHGLTKVVEDGTEYLWLVDQTSAEVAKVTLDGQTVQTLERAPHAIYEGDAPAKYVPTWAAVNPANGDIWVTDGYGSSHIHRYNQAGDYLATINGEQGAGHFACPHGIAFGPDGNLWIADRGNHRLTVYDAEGNYLRHNDDVTHSPCGFDFLGEHVLIPELSTGVKVLDLEMNVLSEAGANPVVLDGNNRPEGWPNWQGTDKVRSGFFNSPHGACFAPSGDIYCVEWIIGGRITKLSKA